MKSNPKLVENLKPVAVVVEEKVTLVLLALVVAEEDTVEKSTIQLGEGQQPLNPLLQKRRPRHGVVKGEGQRAKGGEEAVSVAVEGQREEKGEDEEV